jgi:hypothetical protein
MPVPVLKTVTIAKLHKKKGSTDPATIDATDIAVGDRVKVVGHQGKKPTVWEGKVKAKDGGTWPVDLEVMFEEEPDKEEKGKRGGTEDVSVTVTNATGDSQPLVAKKVVVECGRRGRRPRLTAGPASASPAPLAPPLRGPDGSGRCRGHSRGRP